MDLLHLDRWPPHVAAAYGALHGPRPRADCGRPTRTDHPCEAATLRLMTSCRVHATPAELAATNAQRARLAAVISEWEASLTPACHSWPVTDEHLRAARPAAATTSDREPFWPAIDVLRRWQAGRCAICGTNAEVVDHDHSTGLVRGWLCRSCNAIESSATTGDFTKYRERPPAVILGVAVAYVHPRYGPARPAAPLGTLGA